MLLLQILKVIARKPIDIAGLMAPTYSAGRILTQGVIRPYAFDPGNPKDFPRFGFYGLAGIGGLDNQQCNTLLKKLRGIAKGN